MYITRQREQGEQGKQGEGRERLIITFEKYTNKFVYLLNGEKAYSIRSSEDIVEIKPEKIDIMRSAEGWHCVARACEALPEGAADLFEIAKIVLHSPVKLLKALYGYPLTSFIK